MNYSARQGVFAANVAKLIQFVNESGWYVTFGEAYRTQYQQDEYLRTGKSKAKYSQHQSRLAVDFNLFVDGKLSSCKDDYKPLADFWQSLDPDNRAGYYFKSLNDPYHFEMIG